MTHSQDNWISSKNSTQPHLSSVYQTLNYGTVHWPRTMEKQMFQDGEPKTRQILSLSLKILESASIVGETGSIPGSGRSPGGGNGNPVQYSCLENPMDIGAWWATVHGVTELDMSEQLMHACTCRWIWGRAVKIYARFRGAMNVWCFSSKWHMSIGAGLWHQNRSLLSIDKDQEGWEKTFLGMSLKDTETYEKHTNSI